MSDQKVKMSDQKVEMTNQRKLRALEKKNELQKYKNFFETYKDDHPEFFKNSTPNFELTSLNDFILKLGEKEVF